MSRSSSLYRDARQQLIVGFAGDGEDGNLLAFDQAKLKLRAPQNTVVYRASVPVEGN